MIQMTKTNLKVLLTENHLNDLLDALDQVHTAASEGSLESVTTMNKREMIAYLRDLIYTAQEAINEIDEHACHHDIVLRLIEKPSA